MIVFRCETCAVHQPLRVSMMDALGASLGLSLIHIWQTLLFEIYDSGDDCIARTQADIHQGTASIRLENPHLWNGDVYKRQL